MNPDLVVRDEDGKVMTVRYEAVNAMLLNEFLKEHRQRCSIEGNVAQQQEEFEKSHSSRSRLKLLPRLSRK